MLEVTVSVSICQTEPPVYSMNSTVVEMYDALDRQGNTDKHDVRGWKLFESEIGVHRRNDGGKM